MLLFVRKLKMCKFSNKRKKEASGESDACLVTVTNWRVWRGKRGQITVEEKHVEICESLFMVIKTLWHHGQTWFPCEQCFRKIYLCKRQGKTLNQKERNKKELKIYYSRREERRPVRIISTNSWSFRSLNINFFHPVLHHASNWAPATLWDYKWFSFSCSLYRKAHSHLTF